MTPYFEDGSVTIYLGDAADVLPTLTGVDLIFTSPPYNLGNSSGGGMPGKPLGSRGGVGKWSGGALAQGYDGHADAMPHADYVAWQHSILRQCWATLTDTGAIFYNHKPRVFDGEVVTPLDYIPADLPKRQILIWARAGGVNFSPTFYVPTHEWIVVIAKPSFRLTSKGASGVGDVWRVAQEANLLHPAPFPVGLPARAIETTGPSLVLDPFMGSGSTLRAAKDAGVRAIGIELSERYCEIAARRMAQEPLWGAA